MLYIYTNTYGYTYGWKLLNLVWGMFWKTQFGWTECVCVVFMCFIVFWSEFKSWLSEKKRKPESALSQVQQQKSQHIQQVVDGASHLLAEAV